jgi:dienelactone hydrolase
VPLLESNYYGRAPQTEKVAAIRAPLLLHYAGIDEGVNATVPAFETALRNAGKTYTLHMYEGAQHASTTTRPDPDTTRTRPSSPGRGRSSSSTRR